MRTVHLLSPVMRRAAAAGLLVGAGSAGAVGLGAARGPVTIGRPLDITLPLLQDIAADEAPQCVGANVAYGDSRLSAGSVTAEIEGSGQARLLRVTARHPVDEPVVTVDVQLGCSGRLVRRLVLLADPDLRKVDVPLSRPLAILAPAPRVAAVAPARAQPQAEGVEASPGRRRQAGVPRHATAASSHHAPQVARALPTRSSPHLQLDPVDLRDIAAPGLRVTDSLRPFTDASPERRALALAMWRALNAQPEDILRQEQRLNDLERVQQLAADLQKEQWAGFERRLQASESRRSLTGVLVALGAVAVGALVLALVLWRRSVRLQREARWWEPAAPVRDWDGAALDDDAPATQAQAFWHGEPTGRDAGEAAAPAPVVRAAPHFEAGAAPLELTAKETNEAKHAVDFFAALGQYDRAVDALQNHVAQHAPSSALGWLELLNLLVALGRREEFARARTEFMRLFNADLPGFDQWGDAGDRLEDDPALLARIVALWPSREAMKVLEEALFTEPGRAQHRTLSMASFNELVVLHQVCSELVAAGECGARSDQVPFVFDAGWCPSDWAAMSPAAVAAAEARKSLPATPARKATSPAAAKPRLDLDLDLGEYGSLEAKRRPPVDVDLAALGTADVWGGPEPL